MRGMPVEWTEDPAAFLSREWAPLLEADPDGRFFHTPRYLKLYWEEFGSGPPRVAFVREGDEAVCVAAFDIAGGMATFLGGFEVTDYLGPVGPRHARDRAAKELVSSFAARDDWETADLRGLAIDSGWQEALAGGARDAALLVETEEDGVAPLLSLPTSFDTYLSSLPGKLRHELRRKRRRLHEAFPSVHLVDATTSTLATDFETFAQLHRDSKGRKGRFMYAGMERFFRRLGDALLLDGTFRLVFLEADGARLAGVVGFRDRGRFLLYNSAYDHSQAALSPGIVLLTMLIEDLIRDGCRELDLMKGDEEYKFRLGAVPRRIGRLLLRRD